jgi:teichuronic acid biosynthesis glycosyltransferase TuaG
MQVSCAEDDAALTALMPLKAYDPGYLEEALCSLVAQTCPVWRLLIITEPADTPPLSETLEGWLTDVRVSVVSNQGVRLAGAINTGMLHATTEFVALLFADDLWAPEATEVLTRNIHSRPGVDFFHTSRRIIDDHGVAISSVHPARHGVTLNDFIEGSPVKHLLCWRRSMGLDIGGLDERSLSVGPDDMDFTWTMAEHGAVFHAIDDCLYVYRDHRQVYRLTTHLPLQVHVKELERIYRKHGLPERIVRQRIEDARRSYLRQCLYRSRLHELWHTRLSRTARPWRETYR